MIQHASWLRGTVATTSSLGRALTARWSAVWPEESLQISVLKFCCRQHSSHSKTLRGFMWQPVCPFSLALSLSTKPHWSPTSTTLPVAIKCCQHFTMVCYILPSGLVGCCSLLALCVCLGALAWQAAAWLSKSATLPEDVGAPNSSFKVSTSASSATFCSPHWWSNRFASLARMQWFTNVYDEMRWWDDMAWHGITLHDMRLGDTTWHDREYHNFILYKIMTNCAYKVHTTHINIYVCVTN